MEEMQVPLISPNSYCQKFKSFIKSITVEPILVLILFGVGMESVYITNLWVEKICLFHFNYSVTICDALDDGAYPKEQKQVQQLTSQFNIYSHLIQYLPAAFIVMLLGSWSDKRGRRVPILIPILGFFFTSLGVSLECHWWDLPPEYLLIPYVALGLTGGGLMGLYAGVYPYLGAISSGRTRTTRMAFLGFVTVASATAGQGVAVLVFKKWRHIGVFICQTITSGIAFVYASLALQGRPEGDIYNPHENNDSSVISFTHLKEMVLTVFRNRGHGRRGDTIAHIFIIMMMVFILGSYNYNFLYTRRKFSWDHNEFSIYSLIDTPVSALGGLVILPVLSYYFGVDDCILGMMGGISILVSNVIKGVAPESWWLYLASAAGLCMSQITASSRSALSKLVRREELGAVFAVLGATEAMIPMASSYSNTKIYSNTLDTFPGTIYIVNAGISLVICCLYIWMLIRRSRGCICCQPYDPEIDDFHNYESDFYESIESTQST